VKATITLQEAAQQAHVSRRTLYLWMRHGLLRYEQRRRPEASPHRRVRLADVLRLRDRHKPLEEPDVRKARVQQEAR
jgi:DNA-binding transcriptional MerR regulator